MDDFKWEPSEEEYNLVWGLNTSLIYASDAALLRTKDRLYLAFDLDDTQVKIQLKPHLFPTVQEGDIVAITYLKLKMDEYEWK